MDNAASVNASVDKPIIRAVEAFPIDHEGQKYICLRDPSGAAPNPIVIGMGAYFLVTLFDGEHSRRDLQGAFTKRFGEPLPAEHLDSLINALDDGYFLDSPRYRDKVAAMRDEFMARTDRPAALAGLCYERDPNALRREIEAFFRAPGGPGDIPAPRADRSPLAGIIAPHIDPRRGGRAYAHAYGELLTRERPELIVILGTSHYGAGPQLFTATHKDYMTPLGAVKTDRDFLDRLAARYSQGDLFADELLHRNEHSIEFQTLFLAWSLGVAGYQIAPILVGSFHEMVRDGVAPPQDPRVAGFIDAIRAELAGEKRQVLIVAGVDFAHIGRKFGDPFSADEQAAADTKAADLALIEHIKRCDPAGFFREIAAEGDRRKICGLAPMYVQLELLRGRSARLLMHDIAMEPQTESAVSFASLAID